VFDIFKKYLIGKAAFTDPEIEKIRELSFGKSIRKRQLLLQEGDICRTIGFIAKGCMRMYRVADDGSEHTMEFGIENWWVFNRESFFYEIPSTCNIEAIEDSELILWTKENYLSILNDIPAYGTFREQLIQRDSIAKERRILANISHTAEEKYQQFINQYPDIFSRVPIYMIASYLGVTRKTLGRVRNQYAKNSK
jgi:CRP-like cAMP-binding protein